MTDLNELKAQRDELLKKKADKLEKKNLKKQIFALQHPIQAKIGSKVLSLLTPKAISPNSSRKVKLKRKVASLADLDKALKPFM